MSDKTNFQKVIQFNRSFGVPISDTPLVNITKDNPKLSKLRLDLILEETRELKEAMDSHDFLETVDALADILYVVYGAGASFGIDLDKAFDLVHNSNMSKLCKTEEEARETVRWYEERKEETGYDSPDYRLGDDGVNWVVFNSSTGKILKSINYTPVTESLRELIKSSTV
tara:strand:+ start:364 stop:873 length:510 start_codon:yes stop_codon:yes gene_type:complete